MDKAINAINLRRNLLCVDDSVKIYGRLRLSVQKGANIAFGKNVSLRSGWKENSAGGSATPSFGC